MRLLLGATTTAVLALLLACGGRDDGDSGVVTSSTGDITTSTETTDTEDNQNWNNQGRCPEGADDDVPLPTTCPALEGGTWCWTTVGAELVTFAIFGASEICTTALERPVTALDMTEHAGALYACEDDQLVRIDPEAGTVEVLPRTCRGLASFDGGVLINEGPDVRWYAGEDALRGDSTGLRYGAADGLFIETWTGTLYTLNGSDSDLTRSCTETGESRADLVLDGFEGVITGLSALGPDRMFVLRDDGVVVQHDAATGAATGLTETAPAGASGLLCGAL
jgi:hypothetical protein